MIKLTPSCGLIVLAKTESGGSYTVDSGFRRNDEGIK